jgi:DNA polymerase
MDKEKALKHLREEVKECNQCNLCENATNSVMGEGNPNTEVIFIGEAPGKEEDEKGRPFVGSAGQLLNNLLGREDISRDEIYITNIVKCRPPENRKPRKNEIKACSHHLDRELEIIEPKILAPMGNTAVNHIMKNYGLETEKIGNIHGETFEAAAPWGMVKIVPLYHPAAAIYRRDLMDVLADDMRSLHKLMR